MPVNTDELMKEMTCVLKTGIDKLLADYKDKYTLYEETHQCVVKLQGLLSKSAIPQSDNRYDNLEKQIEQMKEEIAVLKMTGGQQIFYIDHDIPVVVKQEPTVPKDVPVVVKQEPNVPKDVQPIIKAQPKQESPVVVKQEAKDVQPIIKAQPKQESPVVVKQEAKDVQPPSVSEEKENITLIIEPVQEQETEEEEEEESEEEEEEEEEESEEEEEEELSDEDEPVDIKSELRIVQMNESVKQEQPKQPEKEKEKEKEEEEEELFEIEIDDVSYCTNDEENGIIYALTADGDVGPKIGHLKDGEPFFD